MADKNTDNKRQLILNTLRSLMEKNHSDKITVAQLMKEAHLNRQSFYRYFTDIDDAIFCDFSEYVKNAVIVFYAKRDFQAAFTGSAEYIRTNAKYYENLIKYEGINSFKEQYQRLMIEITSSYVGITNLDEKAKFVIVLYWRGASESLVSWIRDGMKIPEETLADYMHASLPALLRTYYP